MMREKFNNEYVKEEDVKKEAFAMTEREITEFDEITLKKIIKNKMVDEFYVNLNVFLGNNHIRNKELSAKIGWDSAGYNQKLNRKSDLKLSTLINMFMSLMDLTDEKNETRLSFYEKYEEMDLTQFFSVNEFKLSQLFLNISASVAGKEEFLNSSELVRTYKMLKPYVMRKKGAPVYSAREKEVYMKFYDMV